MEAALERQELSCTYLAQHELEGKQMISIIITTCQGDAHR